MGRSNNQNLLRTLNKRDRLMSNVDDQYVVHFRHSVQTGPDSFAHTSEYLTCAEDATISEIIKWACSKEGRTPIKLEIAKAERLVK